MSHVTKRYTEKTTKFNYVHNKYNGGFILYWKLYKCLFLTFLWVFGMVKDLSNLEYPINIDNDLKKYRWKRYVGFTLFVLKTPYWLLIKPFAWFIVIQTRYKGTIHYINGDVDGYENLKKYVTIKFRGIPFIRFPWYYTEKDLDYVTK